MDRPELIAYINRLQDQEARESSRKGITLWTLLAASTYLLTLVLRDWHKSDPQMVLGWATTTFCGMYLLKFAIEVMQLPAPTGAVRTFRLARFRSIATSFAFSFAVSGASIVLAGLGVANLAVLLLSITGIVSLLLHIWLEVLGFPNLAVTRRGRGRKLIVLGAGSVVIGGYCLVSQISSILRQPEPIMMASFHLAAAIILIAEIRNFVFPDPFLRILTALEQALLLENADVEETKTQLETELLGRRLGVVLSKHIAEIEALLASTKEKRIAIEQRMSQLGPSHQITASDAEWQEISSICQGLKSSVYKGILRGAALFEYLLMTKEDRRFPETKQSLSNLVSKLDQVLKELDLQYDFVRSEAFQPLCAACPDLKRCKGSKLGLVEAPRPRR